LRDLADWIDALRNIPPNDPFWTNGAFTSECWNAAALCRALFEKQMQEQDKIAAADLCLQAVGEARRVIRAELGGNCAFLDDDLVRWVGRWKERAEQAEQIHGVELVGYFDDDEGSYRQISYTAEEASHVPEAIPLFKVADREAATRVTLRRTRSKPNRPKAPWQISPFAFEELPKLTSEAIEDAIYEYAEFVTMRDRDRILLFRKRGAPNWNVVGQADELDADESDIEVATFEQIL
jgi:hypothetical protein